MTTYTYEEAQRRAEYTGSPQVALERSGTDYGIYLFDGKGQEIVCWTSDEIAEDPIEVSYAMAHHIVMLWKQGDHELKKLIKKE